MANRFSNPDIAYYNSSGQALSGGLLFFYASGTNTKQNTYSNSALSIANPNPVVLDSNGRAGSIFLSNVQYKVVLAPSTDSDPPTSPIWTMDPVYTSDVSTVAQLFGSNGNPNGSIAGTAGSAGVPASVDWDYVNNILYVCTTTGNAASAVWTAVNPSTSQAIVQPQGRLTLQTNTPVIGSDQIAATTVYYTPYVGLLVPIYNGSSFVNTSIVSQLSYGLSSSLIANNIYDLFIASVSGTPTLGSGPSWSAGTGGNITPGSCARGTGAGGSALSYVNGILTNAVSMTLRSGVAGATTTTIAANQATYVGSIFMDATNGQCTDHVSGGQNRKRGLWNAYNRVPIALQVFDSTATWSYSTAAIRASNNTPATYSATEFNVGSGTTCNGMVIFSGLAEEQYEILFQQNINQTGAATTNSKVGWALNSTTVFTNFAANIVGSGGGAGATTASAAGTISPTLGINNICSTENAVGVSNTFNGTQQNMFLQVQWRG